MILQARREATALHAMLQGETERSRDLLRVAGALAALYPKDSEEKRLRNLCSRRYQGEAQADAQDHSIR
jgi:hypothetical protein